MKRLIALMLILMLAVQLMPVLAQGDDDVAAQIDALFASEAEAGNFSGAVLVAREGEVLLSAGYGMANLTWGIPNTPQTRFRIGSITKEFTALAILVLQERGSLSVENPICQYIDDCPDAWQDITIHQLLTHTSGIPELQDSEAGRLPVLRLTHLLNRFINEPLDFSPGERWQYSNSGYVVLGYIIEAVSGTTYIQFLSENFLEPLGMADTGYETNARIIERHAEGYSTTQRKASYIDMSNLYAAGGLYSTIEDLYRWDQALQNGEVVSQESWDAAVEAAVPIDGRLMYGYGVYLNPALHAMSHGGMIPGFQATLTHLIDENITTIILSNLERGNIFALEEAVVRMLLPELPD